MELSLRRGWSPRTSLPSVSHSPHWQEWWSCALKWSLIKKESSHSMWSSGPPNVCSLMSLPESGMHSPVLVISGCYNKNSLDWVVYKQQKFVSHSSGVWKVQDQVASMVMFWCGPTSGSQIAIFFLCSHMAEGAWKLSAASFVGAPSLWLNNLSKAPPLNIITLELRTSTHKFRGDMDVQSTAGMFCTLLSPALEALPCWTCGIMNWCPKGVGSIFLCWVTNSGFEVPSFC